ncbi:MAG: hypothetical protein ACLU38_06835 [Dysosmobacter sp.]
MRISREGAAARSVGLDAAADEACGGKTAVIGISGGKDSSVVAALAVAAYGKENRGGRADA